MARTRIPTTSSTAWESSGRSPRRALSSAVYIGIAGHRIFPLHRHQRAYPLRRQSRSIPNPSLGQVRQMQSDGYLKGNTLELTFRGKPSNIFPGRSNTLSAAPTTTPAASPFFPRTAMTPTADWGRADNDRLHKFDLLGSMQPTRFFTLGVSTFAIFR